MNEENEPSKPWFEERSVWPSILLTVAGILAGVFAVKFAGQAGAESAHRLLGDDSSPKP